MQPSCILETEKNDEDVRSSRRFGRGDILSRVSMVSLGAVRSSNKKWNALSKNRIFGMAPAARKQFLGFMMMDDRVCSLSFDLNGIRNDKDFVGPSIKQIGKFSQVEISRVFYFDGLLLCITKDQLSLVVWNPYLVETRWIQPKKHFHVSCMCSLGYDSNNRHHKILMVFDEFEIYDFSSDSWRVLDVIRDWEISSQNRCRGVSLNGNAYFLAIERTYEEDEEKEEDLPDFLVSFDFTTERFGPRLSLPFHTYGHGFVTLSCVREEQLAVLYEETTDYVMKEIWVTTKIEPNAVSWSMFLKVDITSVNGFPDDFDVGSFFIDEEKKVAAVFDIHGCDPTITYPSPTAHIIGEDDYFKSVNIIAPPNLKKPNKYEYSLPLVSSSYVPSLVQVQINQLGKRKVRDY